MSRVDLVSEAISFAAESHLGQLRKDGATPYIAHPFRVCMLLRNRFGVRDPETLAAAVLHDCIEDTTVDRDDLIERFGETVAATVAALSKDMRLPEAEREASYIDQLVRGSMAVKICKLGDILDNLADSASISREGLARQVRRAEALLESFRNAEEPGAASDAASSIDAATETETLVRMTAALEETIAALRSA